ncbi:hypothetical protein TPHA_0F02140 [Tetrapisispora phaffii CBS 4417]|uniref:FAR-17a/AIG1-like protein n=1 Tax=Tetrapisispora phaffii (strain ATCC 24235 / CBS 4417 / NBRC 1672 / NRRL Y-8282 / UCD 70-5) TaxID=1071381 RepID=G8BVB4_TETPH|nr:hypothetical protein TPHA_0F02140 [Tetrapisispora phaffii CBS 4417]CCE63696.1 hypothetical protein TPHA_0F02140 [Tetrapisispora phaffii CBS 4417]
MTVSRLPTIRSIIINSASVIILSWGLWTCTSIILPQSLASAGHKQFLTNISVVASLLSNYSNIFNFFIQRYSNDKVFKNTTNFIARHICLPIALVLESIVVLVYWPLKIFFYYLIYQGANDNSRTPIPLSVDFAIHLFPIIFLLSDHYLSGYGEYFSISKIKAFILVTILGFSYNRWLYYLIDLNGGGAFPYPFLSVPEPFRTIIFISITTVGWLFYVLYQKFPPSSRLTSHKKIN